MDDTGKESLKDNKSTTVDENLNDTNIAKDSECGTQQAYDVFDNANGDVKFRGLSWQAAAILIAKFQIGLGALSLPNTFHVLGFFPGILCFVIMASISTVAGYVSGNAGQYYPHIHSVADAADILFGKTARELVGAIYYIYLAMTAGAGMLTTSVALNALSDHGTCTMVFVAVTCVIAFIIGTGLRSLEKVSWISWAGVAGMIISIWITVIACLTQDRPAAAPSTGPIDRDIRVFPNTTFTKAMAAVSNQLFAIGGSGTFFSVAAEMERPEHFTRALMSGQIFIIFTCITISSIMYGKVGQYLASPALGSAGPLIKKVSYGIALPGLLVTAILWSHIAAKYWFVRILRGTRHLQSNTVKHFTVWIGSMLGTVIFAFVIVSVVPFFNDFLSLVGALLNPVFTNIMPGFMILVFISKRPVKVAIGVLPPRTEESDPARHWLLNAFKAYKKGRREATALAVACFLLITGAFIVVGGTYATVLSIQASYDEGEVGSVFSCGDNSK
ncbi:hypothetical protein N7475_006774 [Penicillium sp. IBT 31633x]|nr:hypothetical protein N7475_006774 [Penicillium sp. IBT 31633x]